MHASDTTARERATPAAPGLEPEDIENRMRYLLRFYTRTRSPAIALSIARHLELLAEHPLFEAGGKQRCDYLRMRNHWRWLSELKPPEVAT